MHINVSAEQHTQSLKQLLKNITGSPEALTELARWGLDIGLDIMVVGPCPCAHTQTMYMYLISTSKHFYCVCI